MSLHRICFLSISIVGLAGCGQLGSDAEELVPLTVASWSQQISEQTNLLVDDEKLFFSEEGIDLTMVPGNGGGDAIKNILTGKADIAFTDPGALYSALA